jgi:hypothetical protein
MRPLILLDVDGVLNQVRGARGARALAFDDFQTAVCNGWKIRYSPLMGKRLAALEADIVWLTTWGEEANTWIGPLFGWEPLPVVERTDEDDKTSWWKSPAALRFLTEQPTPPFIWIDDDLFDAVGNGEVRWLQDATLPRHLLISPEYDVALVPSALDQIEQWIAAL